MWYAVKRPDGGLSIFFCDETVTIQQVIAKRLTRTQIMTNIEKIVDLKIRTQELENVGKYVASDDVVEIFEVDPTILPNDRDFRNGWTIAGDKFAFDMVKCKEIHRVKMRAVRDPKLKELDVEYQRADEAGDAAKKQKVVAKKQALRDVTADPRIEAATTVEELKQVWPDILKENANGVATSRKP